MASSLRNYNLGNCIFAVCFAVVVTLGSTAHADWSSITRFVPSDANSLLLLNSKQIRSSKWFAAKNVAASWEQLRAEMPLAVPPGATHLAIASRMDIVRLKPLWEVAIVEAATEWELDPLSATGGIEKVGEVSFFIIGDQAVVKFSKTELGVMRPADRQTAIRWINDVKAARTGNLPELFKEKIASKSDALPVATWLVDAQHLFSPQFVDRAMSRSAVLQANKHDKKAVQELLVSFRGFELGLVAGESLNGGLKFSFEKPVAPVAPFAGALVTEFLNSSGLAMDEVTKWEARAEGNHLQLQGSIEDTSVRKLFGLLLVSDQHSPVQDALESMEKPAEAPTTTKKLTPEEMKARDTAIATKRYIHGVMRISTDFKNIKNADLYRQLQWVQNYGRRIDSMSTRNVEPEVAKLGKAVAAKLLEIVDVYTSGDQRAAERQAAVIPDVQVQGYFLNYDRVTTPWGRYYNYDPTFSYNYNYKSTMEEYRKVTSEELATCNEQSAKLIAEIVQNLRDLEHIASEKYPDKK